MIAFQSFSLVVVVNPHLKKTTHNNLFTLVLLPFVCMMVGGWVNILKRSGLIDSLWELGLSSYTNINKGVKNVISPVN